MRSLESSNCLPESTVRTRHPKAEAMPMDPRLQAVWPRLKSVKYSTSSVSYSY